MFLLELYFSDHFTFFAMFDFSSQDSFLVSDWFRKLVSRIPDKPKLGVLKGFPVVDVPETFQVNAPSYYIYDPMLLLEILNKRWQTLDLISMMAEYKRSVGGRSTVKITDSLSSLPRFKRKEELSVSQ